MAPDAEVDNFQDYVQDQCGRKLGDHNANVLISVYVVFGVGHDLFLLFEIQINIITMGLRQFLSFYYRFIGTFLYYSLQTTMSAHQDYQRLLIEIQSLKKSLSAEKLAHESTVTQLQNSFNLNLELQQVIKTQASSLTNLNRQLNDKANKLTQMSQSYEIQLMELKEFVHAKERELQGIRGALLGTDYDVIRLRIVGELELVHREQVEEVQKEKDRAEKLLADEKQARLIITEKFQHLKKELDRQAERYEEEKQQIERKHMREMNKNHQSFQIALRGKRQAQKSLETLQKRHQSLQQKYQSEINKVYDQIKRTDPLQQQRGYSPEAKPSKIAKYETDLHQKTMEIESLIRKMEKEKVRYEQSIKDLERKLKDAKENAMNVEQYTNKANEKQRQHDQTIKTYEKKLRSLKQDHQDEIRRMRKENELKIDELRQKYRIQKENIAKSSNVEIIDYSPRFGLEKRAESPQKDREIERLTQQIKALQRQNDRLKKQGTSVNRSFTMKTERFKNESTEVYKLKLKEANEQIMSLLLQKVSMKQELGQRRQ